MERTRRRLRALPFCLGLWLAPPVIGTPRWSRSQADTGYPPSCIQRPFHSKVPCRKPVGTFLPSAGLGEPVAWKSSPARPARSWRRNRKKDMDHTVVLLVLIALPIWLAWPLAQ
jgi:hypothetical protein